MQHQPIDQNAQQTDPLAIAQVTTIIGEVIRIQGASAELLLDKNLLDCFPVNDHDLCLATCGQIGTAVKMRVGASWIVGVIRAQSLYKNNASLVVSDVDFLGEGLIMGDGVGMHKFRKGITRFPIAGAPVFPCNDADIREIYANQSDNNIEIGRVFPSRNIRASINVDSFLGKHFALVGSTGTGKSTSAALILHRICDKSPDGHIIMIDPHGEYGKAFHTNGVVLDVKTLALPWWMMNFTEHCEMFLTSEGADLQTDKDILAKGLIAARKTNKAAADIQVTVDTPIPYLLSDLLKFITQEMGKLDKSTGSAPYLRIIQRIEAIKSDPRYQFMFSGMLVNDIMAEFIANIFRMKGDGKPISVIDVSGVPSDITSTVVGIISRIVFDYAIWNKQMHNMRPILLVCEEAHRYLPSEKAGGFNAARDVLGRIAKEGRKYGISLGLITQRPSDLSQAILSQCGTILAMRLNNEVDKSYVKSAMPGGSRGFVKSISALRNRECIVVGEGVSVPYRFGFDDLEEERRPASDDPSFVESWKVKSADMNNICQVVERWRTQGQGKAVKDETPKGLFR